MRALWCSNSRNSSLFLAFSRGVQLLRERRVLLQALRQKKLALANPGEGTGVEQHIQSQSASPSPSAAMLGRQSMDAVATQSSLPAIVDHGEAVVLMVSLACMQQFA